MLLDLPVNGHTRHSPAGPMLTRRYREHLALPALTCKPELQGMTVNTNLTRVALWRLRTTPSRSYRTPRTPPHPAVLHAPAIKVSER